MGRLFSAGDKLLLSGNKRLPPQLGTIMFSSVVPLNATVRYRASDEKEWRTADVSTTLSLPPGSYEFNTTAPKYKDLSLPVVVEGDKTKQLFLVLIAAAAPVVQPPLANMEEAVKNGDWFTGTQPKGFLIVRPGYTKNTIIFLKRPKPKRLQWVVGLDGDNYITYNLDSQGVSISKVLDGTKSTVPVPIDASDSKSSGTYAVVIYFDHGVQIKKRDGTLIHAVPDDKHDWTHARISIRGDSHFTVWRGQ
jgi:hypothetical protein